MRVGLLVLLLSAPLGAGDEARVFLEGRERTRFLQEVERKMSGVRSFVADFEQRKKLSVFKGTAVSSGFILFQRPDHLRWEIRKPFRSILIVSGNGVAKFEFVGGKRRALKLGRGRDAILIAMERIRSWFQGDFDGGGKHYEVKVSRRPTPLIVLTPVDARLKKTLRAIEFTPTKDLAGMRQVTIRERGGDHTDLAFRRRTDNVKAPAAAFSLEEPKELDLAKLRATAGDKR
jgi:outer membrane lipoprotein-sorting protein